MWLVLCEANDISALWAGRGMRARGLKPVEFVSPVELACAPLIEYRAGDGSEACASAELSSGRRIEVRRLLGTLNRAGAIDYPQVRRAQPADRAYVQAEMDAITLAWLGALPAPVFNPVHPSGWGGAQSHPFAWALRAQAAGFLTAPHRCGHSGMEIPIPSEGFHTTVHLVLGDRTFPALPKGLESAGVRLARSVNLPLLGIVLHWTQDGQALFAGATPTPDLRVGGDVFLDALTAAFTAR